MKVDKTKLELKLAEKQMRTSDIESLSRYTVHRIKSGYDVRPLTVGKLAAELGVNVSDLVDRG